MKYEVSEKGYMAKRIIFVIIALLFLFTSIGFSGLVIWQMRQDSQESETVSDTSKQQVTPKEGKLEGTKLSNFTPATQVDQTQVLDLTQGTGEAVKAGDTITAHYTGALAKDGTIFESSKDSGQPFTAKLEVPSAQNGGKGLIAGWVEGIPGMKAGGTRRLIIPANLAYGTDGSPPKIGPNEPLVFDIELVKIGQ